MKKKLISIIIYILLFCNIINAQTEKGTFYYKRFNDIVSLIKNKDYYTAIKKMDEFLHSFPDDAVIYYNRGLVHFLMNDYEHARKDIEKAKSLGFNEKQDFVNYITSKEYLVKLLSKHYIDFALLNPNKNYKQNFGRKDSLRGALRPERTCYDVYYYNLTVKILPSTKSIEGNNVVYFKTKDTTNRIQIDLSQNLQICSIKWKGREQKFTRIDDAVFINFDMYIQKNEKESITIYYSGKPRIAPSPPWDAGFVWKRNRLNWWVGVSCEQLGASSWWPCKDHLSDKPDSMSINVQVPKKYQAVANGNLRSTKIIDSKYTNYEWFVSYPINSYCVTFYMGKFENINEKYTNANGSYSFDYYVLHQHLNKAKTFYSQMKDIVTVYEDLYGEYPYKNDGIGMVEAPFAGMEHQSAIAIGDEYGKNTPWNYKNIPYNYLLIHETAHEWWGNTVTMADMADAWLSEGFTTYSEQLFMEKKFGYSEYLKAASNNMQEIFNIWPIVGYKDVNDNSFIGGDIYNKGATVLNNLRCCIDNDSLFFAIIKGFYTENRFKSIATKDFTNYVNTRTKHDYSDFFNTFLYNAEPPILEYQFTQKNDTLTFSYKWINVGKNFTMPLSITTNDSRNIRLIASYEPQTIVLENVKSFYIPNENRYNKDIIGKNSLTYFWTSWNSLTSLKL